MMKLRIWPVLLLCVLVVLCGCTAKSADQVNVITSLDLPPADNVFRIPLLTNPPDLDPILVSDTTSDGIASKIFNTLVSYDQQLNLEPSVAVAMPEISADGLTYTFQLRSGIRFSNGREITAEDVKYSLQRLAGIRSKRSNLVEPIAGASEAIEMARKDSSLVSPEIKGIVASDPHTIQITLSKPYAPFIYHLAMVNTAVVPREAVERSGLRFSREPVGTGPFRLVEWKENNSLYLAANPDYFQGAPKLAGIRYRIIPEALTRLEEYKSGGLEITVVTQGVYPEWKNSNRVGDIRQWPSLAVQYYGFNLEKEGSPYAGMGDSARKLREAVNWAVDREFLGEVLLEGRFYPANGIIPPGVAGYDASRPAFQKDLERSSQLLFEAGYPGGDGLPPVDLWFNNQGDNSLIAQVIQEDLKKAGITIVLKQLDWGAFIEATDSGEPAFFRLGWVADYPDPENFLAFLFHSKNKGPNGNVSFYGRPEVDDLSDRSYSETDMGKRIALLQEASKLILSDSPWLFLLFGKETVLLKPYVKNYNPTGMCDDVAGNHVKWHLVEIDRGQVTSANSSTGEGR